MTVCDLRCGACARGRNYYMHTLLHRASYDIELSFGINGTKGSYGRDIEWIWTVVTKYLS
jgi:hypothetical protein